MTSRAGYAEKGRVLAPEGGGTAWTVIVLKDATLEPPVGSRVIFVKPIVDLRELGALNNRKTQTIGVAGFRTRVMKQASEFTRRGGDRLPALGKMNSFSSPWDGMFSADRLVRWVRMN